MKRLTASALPVIAQCPAGPSLPQVPQRANEYGAIGNAAHEYYKTGKLEHDTFLEVPEFLRPEERTSAFVMHEWRFGWNFKTGEFIMLPEGLQPRDYGDKLPSDCYGKYPKEEWLMGSVDAAWQEEPWLDIEDLKTGAPKKALSHQTVFLGKVACEVKKHQGSIRLTMLNATRYGYVGEAKSKKGEPKAFSKFAGKVIPDIAVLSRAELEAAWKEMVEEPVLRAVALAELNDHTAVQAAAVVNRDCYQSCGGRPWCDAYRATAKAQGLATLDKLRAQVEGKDEQSERNESSGQGDNGPDTGGHDGGGTGER